MSNDWEDWRHFREKYDRIVGSYKSKVIVTIYGSYYPPAEKKLLKDLKAILIQDGYVNTTLVEDRQKANDAPLEISQRCMLYSDINLLIFTKRGRKYGVIDELAFLTDDRRMFDKIPFSKIFYQVKAEGNSALPPSHLIE